MNLTNMIKKAAIGIAMTGALVGSAYAQTPAQPMTQAEIMAKVKQIEQGLKETDGHQSCFLANLAYHKGTLIKGPDYGNENIFTVTTTSEPGAPDAINQTIELVDFNKNGPGNSDKLRRTAGIRGVNASAELAIEGCGVMDSYRFFHQFKMRNVDSNIDWDTQWSLAIWTIKNGIFDAEKEEYRMAGATLRSGTVEECNWSLFDVNKNGVDVGDTITKQCKLNDILSTQETTVLEGKPARINLQALEDKYFTLKDQIALSDRLDQELATPENICLIANFAYYQGSEARILAGGTYHEIFATERTNQPIPAKFEFFLVDKNGFGPNFGDSLQVFVKYADVGISKQVTLGAQCHAKNEPREFDRKFILRNETLNKNQNVSILWAMADFAAQAGVYNNQQDEYAVKVKVTTKDTNEIKVCSYSLFDHNKNGVDIGDKLSWSCSGSSMDKNMHITVIDNEQMALIPVDKYSVLLYGARTIPSADLSNYFTVIK